MYSVCFSCTQEGTRFGDGRNTIAPPSLATDVPANSEELKCGVAAWCRALAGSECTREGLHRQERVHGAAFGRASDRCPAGIRQKRRVGQADEARALPP